MTGGLLPLGYDDVRFDPVADVLSVSTGPANRGRPVWAYWFPLLCRLFPATMRAASVGTLAARGTTFAYPVELRFEVDEWCFEAPAAEPLLVLPPELEEASVLERVVVVVSIAHEGRPLFEPAAGPRAPLLDRVAEVGRLYGLPAERLWLLSGNLDGTAEVHAWRDARGLAALPFTFRACEPFSAFVAGCAQESLYRGRAPVAKVSFSRRGPHAVGWRTTAVGWATRPFPGLPGGPAPPRPHFRYACLNRMFRPHRWQVLSRLWQAGVLDRGLVSFPRPSLAELRDEGIDPATAPASDLLGLLPLTVDRSARFDDPSFFAENSEFVGLHPPPVLQDCAMELVTETQHEGCRFVSEKTFKALLGRGPAAVVGTRGVLSYLHSLGVRTWPDHLDERYDQVADPGSRLVAAVDSALELIDRPRQDGDAFHAARSHNLRWLLDAPKPWDTLVAELVDTVGRI